jgi:hypothetical protein
MEPQVCSILNDGTASLFNFKSGHGQIQNSQPPAQ